MALRVRHRSRSNPLREAINIVCCEYGTPAAQQPLRIRGVTRFGELSLFTQHERVQMRAMRDLIHNYVARSSPPRPLSLAVFGPPGSGKSFAVSQILKNVEITSDNKLSRIDVNLTQIPDANALGKVLARASRLVDGTVPVFFFDEFDAPKSGAPFGWLAWFLAPMQDGEFVYDGEVIPLHRAVYVFAGGTAATLEQFSSFERLPEFQRAKGPDFISRLRGFLDVAGPNAEPRLLRRAVLFRAEFMNRARRTGGRTFRPDRELMELLLQVGRYRHGARSIAAIVELSNVDEKRRRFGWDGLPKDHLLRLHIDRGPLDAKLIGGTVAFSGYHESSKSDVANLWREVAHRLWNEGATLSYAGRWAAGRRGWLMKFLEQELRKRPPEPSAALRHRTNPDPWLESVLDNSRAERTLVNGAISPDDRNSMGLHVTFAPLLTREERGLDRWLCSALDHFRRRLAVTDSSAARFVVAGVRSGYYGRFPGIPEEVMLSLAQAKPIYIAGGFGGAAADIGSLLWLAHPPRGEMPTWLQAEPMGNEELLSTIADKLRPGPWTDLPINANHLALFLSVHALGGPKWPNNGLTFDENRRLFASKDRDEVGDLIVNGLRRRFSLNRRREAEQ
jgi:SLOG cluster2